MQHPGTGRITLEDAFPRLRADTNQYVAFILPVAARLPLSHSLRSWSGNMANDLLLHFLRADLESVAVGVFDQKTELIIAWIGAHAATLQLCFHSRAVPL